jgi:tRNA(Ile2) C34 agmatinyltransferase TiaS
MTLWFLLGIAVIAALYLLSRPRPAPPRCPQCGGMPHRTWYTLGQRTFYQCRRCSHKYDRVRR